MRNRMSKKALFFLTLTLSIMVFIVSAQPAQAAGCDGANIIFSEIDYDQPGGDSAEFLELFIMKLNHCLWQWNKYWFHQCIEYDEYHIFA